MTGTTPKSTRLKYRPDVDGLRAVAVLAVMAFHMQTLKGPFPGGFIGVDVFFVISGYLISSIVFFEIANSQFSIVSFYERRIRRIFPALLFVLAVVSIYAYLYLLPSELEDYAKSLVAATLSASNFYFWQHSGYFDSPLSNPLLHTWSLAVEEQFYILFPIFLVLVRRLLPHRLRLSVFVLAALSLVISAVGAYRDPTATFYMPYTRAWELLLGTILSLNVFPPVRSKVIRNIATASGLALILIPIHWYTRDTPFPGLAALPPCAGAALIIAMGESGPSLVGKMLSLRPMVFVGLISYSLYLWHWPIIAFRSLGIYSNAQSHRVNNIYIFVLSFVLATVTWRFVERPFRNGRLRLSGSPLFALAATSAGVLVVFGSAALLGRGFPYRFPAKAVQVATYLEVKENTAYTRLGSCFITSSNSFSDYDAATCLRTRPGEKNYLLVGDSHSAVLWHPLANSLPNTNVMEAAASGCKPFVDWNGWPNCARLMNFIFHDYLLTHRVDCLLVTSRWEEEDIPGLTKLAAWARLKGIPIVIIGPVQEYDAPLPRLLAYSIDRNEPQFPYKHRTVSLMKLDQKLQDLAANVWHVRYISVLQMLCNSDSCIEYADADQRVPIMFDRDHLSNPGSQFVVQSLLASRQLP